MHIINLDNYSDFFVMHYGGATHSVDAKVFAASINHITTALEEISFLTNPAYRVEVRIEALAEGSFSSAIKLVWYKTSDSIKPYMPEKNQTVPLLISLLALNSSSPSASHQNIITGENNRVTIVQGDVNLNVSGDVYIEAEKMKSNKLINNAIAHHFEVIDSSPQIESFGISENINSEEFAINVPKAEFKGFVGLDNIAIPDDPSVKVEKDVELGLFKVVLQRGKRKWEFIWNGFKISAPVLDDDFWNDLESHKIEISQGDTIIVDLKVNRVYDSVAKVYVNDSYEIVRVREYKKTYKQKDELFPRYANQKSSKGTRLIELE